MGKAWELYEYDYSTGTIKLKNRKCRRCGRVMAYHETPKPRWACGYCGFTEYIQAEEKK
ncbi:MAG: 30S ribosomal protein S27ae [Candidatus Verstraetearchaeota archaeon]|nr:30S ribosomal protein S27ae [Candidatus Verstraetearchaeota archaeon]